MLKVNPQIKVTRSPSTGEMEAAYIKIRDGVVAETRDADEHGNAFADYDESGVLLGIELLAPCTARVLDRIAMDGPEPFVGLSQYAPHGMVYA
jgi:uncharacterized protein YuzE